MTTSSSRTESVDLSQHIDQVGITTGPRKLALFRRAISLREIPLTEANLDDEGNTISPVFRVKFFDPCGSMTWYVQDWDGEDTCFGYVTGTDYPEYGYFSLSELSEIKGALGIGIEVDVNFQPVQSSEIITA